MLSPLIAHLRQDASGAWHIQDLDAHLDGVARLAASFADAADMGAWGRALGLFHDAGKARTAFQRHIRCHSGYDTAAPAPAEHNHAYAGAVLAVRRYGAAATVLLANAIASHHTALHDSGALQDALAKPLPPEVEEWARLAAGAAAGAAARPAQPGPLPFKGRCLPRDLHHVVRFLFSCLVDADWLDTEAFMQPCTAAKRGGMRPMAELLPVLQAHLDRLNAKAAPTPVNVLRRRVQRQAIEAASMPPGCYTMTVPTGGGKTLSALAWAMHHAVRHGQRRVIIAIPYTTIIAQTAETLRRIFGADNVVEHHCAVADDAIGDDDPRRLATENWDAPIVCTTNVRLFESLYAARPAACRRLHNVARSVVILDEVQTLPRPFLQPIVDAIDAYSRLFHTSVLFTTASQPVLGADFQGSHARLRGLSHLAEIIPSAWRLHDALRRVCFHADPAPSTYDEMAARLAACPRVLCVVNTRRDARELFRRLPCVAQEEGICVHLSRMMCAAHLRRQIDRLKEALAREDGVVRVVATQLIEAGVDLDFPVVFRQEAGLDSVLQAAGRCNREGRLATGHAHVFSLAAEHPLPAGSLAEENEARKALGAGRDWGAPDTMADYFRQLYARTPTFDAKQMDDLLRRPEDLNFRTAAEAFRLISESGVPVLVPYGDCAALVERLRGKDLTRQLLRQLGDYTVTLHRQDFDKLCGAGAVECVKGVYVMADRAQYDEMVGLRTDNHWQEELLMA